MRHINYYYLMDQKLLGMVMCYNMINLAITGGDERRSGDVQYVPAI